MTRFRPLLAALTVAALLTAGCTSADDPKPNYSSVSTTPSSASSTTSTSPSPTGFPSTGPNVNPGEVPPTEPAGARTNSSAGAIAFVSYYVKTTDWLFATSDTSILTPFFADSCSTCRAAQQYLAGLLTNGGHFTGGRIALRTVQVVNNDGRQSADFAITSVSDVAAAEIVSPSGAVVKNFSATQGFQLTDWVRFIDGSWRIVEERKV